MLRSDNWLPNTGVDNYEGGKTGDQIGGEGVNSGEP